MSLLSRIGLGRSTESSKASEFHEYTKDLLDLTKLRERALQAAILNKPGAKAEVENYDRLIMVAQKTILRLTEGKEEK